MPAVPRTRRWTATEIEDLILELVGNLKGKDPDDLRAELEGKNPIMPIDSFDLNDVLAEFRQRTGITLPKKKIRKRTMRSVKAFADFAATEGRV